jgi:hypothetical protein
MTILQIYQQYHIPINLRQHMLRVAAVGKIVSENCNSDRINQDLVIKTLLLHDMGNILKFNFDNTSFFIKEDKKKIDTYRQIQLEFTTKYGSDADIATIKIIKEITTDQKIIDLCANTHGQHVKEFLDTSKWNYKICYYSDMRIDPNGVVSIDNRFEDLIARYPKKDELVIYQQQCEIIESQLQKISSIDLQSISNKMVQAQFQQLQRVDI